ncbi:MAG: WXG100 family type VII secretion target, partial [Chloroflexota bacterium]
MAEQTSLNYSELKKIAKNFDDESEVLAELLSRTRQMVHDLQDDWMGDAGERFFDEMESEILPAMERLTQALSFTAGTVRKIVKTFDDAEFETVEFFSDGRLERSNAGAELSGLDFGIGGAVDAPSQGIGVGDL